VLPPKETAKLLEQRCLRLEVVLAQAQTRRALIKNRKVPRLFWIEAEYRRRLKAAELEWVRELAGEIKTGKMEGIAEWRDFHKTADVSRRPEK
jgi:septum formation inhibitor-activating ATPase MinD